MQRTIEIDNLNSKSKILFFSANGTVDFSKGSTHVWIYFNDSLNIAIDIFAELYIFQNNQPQTNVFELYIPPNTTTAKIVISTTHDANLIQLKVD